VPSYRVEFIDGAAKALDKITPPWRGRILAKILDLAEVPRPPGCIRLQGSTFWRIRVGDYRVIYEIVDALLLVTIVKVRHRSDVYRR
jgi:mRNA interferase RelE/StbE